MFLIPAILWGALGCTPTPPPAEDAKPLAINPSEDGAVSPEGRQGKKNRRQRRRGSKEGIGADDADDAATRSPNVLILLWDTVRADRLTPYGYDRPTTPYLDRLALGARVYEQARSSAVGTVPSHSSMFTGLTVAEHGATAGHIQLDEAHVTLAEALSQGGFDTFAFSANPFVSRSTGILQGFDVVQHPWDPERLEVAKRLARRYAAEGDINAELVRAKIARADDWAYQIAAPIAEQALLSWLGAREDPSRPFFAFVNLMEAHATRQPSRSSRRALIDEMVEPRARRLDQTPLRQLGWMAGSDPMTDLDLEAMSQVYDASLRDLDDALASLHRALATRGALDNTLLVVVADHGDALGDHERMGHQFHVYDSVARVPLIMSWPGHLLPQRITEPVDTTNLVRILDDLTGLPLQPMSEQLDRHYPEGSLTVYSSVLPGSLKRLRKKDPSKPFTEFETTYRALAWRDHKLIVPSLGRPELYNFRSDPAEAHPISDRALLGEGMQLMDAWSSAEKPWTPAPAAGVDPTMRQSLEALGYVVGQ